MCRLWDKTSEERKGAPCDGDTRTSMLDDLRVEAHEGEIPPVPQGVSTGWIIGREVWRGG